jgi:hypothetical protein
VSIRLVQRLPAQTRGFFQARGFAVADADYVAVNCVFQTIFRNAAPAASRDTIDYDLREWRVHAGGASRAPMTREDWKTIWTERKAPLPAQLAFEWGLLPTQQRYGPGDFNWGMSVYGLAPGARFDLDVVWHRRGQRHAARVADVRCAPDVAPEPSAQ